MNRGGEQMADTREAVRRLAADEVVLPSVTAGRHTRRRIIEVSLGLFAEKGFAGTSIRDIAGAVGIRTSTLYGHFPTKEHILAELSEEGHRAHLGGLVAAVEAAPDDPVAQLTDLVRAHVLFHARFQMLAVVANAELHSLSPDLARESLRLRSASASVFTDVVRAGVDAGRFETPDEWMAVAAIAGMGVRVASWYGPQSPQSPDEIADAYAEFALRILGTHTLETRMEPR
jgi:AcrR family transcriptional regulator